MKYPQRFIHKRHPDCVGNVRDYGYRSRREIIAGMTIHSTRSGKVLPDEGERTERYWGTQAAADAFSYGDRLLFKNGTRIVCTDVDANEFPKWTAGYGARGITTWAMCHRYLQFELPQGRVDEPFPDAVIDSLAEETALLAREFDFPIRRIEYVSQQEEPTPRGITSHDGCANGRVYGKSDPGPLFPWDEYLARARAYYNEEDELSAEDKERLERLERLLCDDILVDVSRPEDEGGNYRVLVDIGFSQPIPGTRIRLKGDQAVRYADLMGMRLLLGLAETQMRVGAIEARPAGEPLAPGTKFTAEVQ